MSKKRKLHPWGSYERVMQHPWPVTLDEQAAAAAYWRQRDAKARENLRIALGLNGPTKYDIKRRLEKYHDERKARNSKKGMER